MQLLLCPQATLSSWQRFEAEREAVWSFINRTDKELHRDLIFNSLDSLRAEIEQSKVWNHRQHVKIVRSPRNSASLATCSKNLFLPRAQELLMKAVECSVRADLLLEKAADAQLGPKTKKVLLEQAQTTGDAVTQLQGQLNKKYVCFPHKPKCRLNDFLLLFFFIFYK